MACLGGGPANPIDRIRVSASAQDVRRAMGTVRDRLTATDLRPETQSRAELVLSEVLNNVVEHAQRDRPDGCIDVAIIRCKSGVCLQVTDDGHPMPGQVLPDGNPPDLDVDTSDLPEGGFGWYMIRSMSDDLRYSRSEAGNYLCICIREGADEAA